MGISGFIENFSLPEIFQFIESGKKSGKLEFKCLKNPNPDLQGVFEIWFDRGSFVAIVNSFRYKALIEEIKSQQWVDLRTLIKHQLLLPKNEALGSYLLTKNILNSSQLDHLFEIQINQTIKLFNIKAAWYQFEEIYFVDPNIINSSLFPWEEMTGRQKKAMEISLEAIRKSTNISHDNEEIPPDNCGLYRLIESCNLQFSRLEKELCNAADGSISLSKIARRLQVSVKEVQKTARSMIVAGLVEQTPVVSLVDTVALEKDNIKKTSANSNYKQKSQVSNSLLHNLVDFLKNSF